MTIEQNRICEKLKRFGFTRESRIRLYGSQFDVVGDPLMIGDNLAFVDAIETKSGELRRVRIPIMIVRMAGQETAA